MRLTPGAFGRRVRALGRRLKRQRREALVHAWQVGGFVGMSKPAPLDEILRKFDGPATRAPMSDEEIMHTMGLWIARGEGIEARQKGGRDGG